MIVDGAGSFDCFFINSDGNVVKGLRIFNCGSGVEVNGGQNNTIGGSSAAERNVISGNGYGVFIAVGTNGNTVKGNYIGTDAAGTAAIPNGRGVYHLRRRPEQHRRRQQRRRAQRHLGQQRLAW